MKPDTWTTSKAAGDEMRPGSASSDTAAEESAIETPSRPETASDVSSAYVVAKLTPSRPETASDDSSTYVETKLVGKEDPLNWGTFKKGLYTAIVVSMTAIVCFSSSVLTPAVEDIAKDLKTTPLTASMGSMTYLFGFGLGPFIIAPLSELWGRNPVYYVTFLFFSLSNLGCTEGPTVGVFLVFRFFAGFFGAPILSNAGGTITDLWAPSQRSVPFAFYTAATVCGPVLGPIVGGALTEYTPSWRWNFYVVMTISVAIYVAAFILLPETYGPKLLQDKLGALVNGDEKRKGSVTSLESGVSLGSEKKKTIREALRTPFTQSLLRPWIMLFCEPLLLTLSTYMGFINGVLFLLFTAYNVVFEEKRGWSMATSGIPLLGIGAGMAIATAISPLLDRLHARSVARLGPVPEARLPHLIIISWFLPLGLFWFGWSAMPPTHWIWCSLSGLPFGFGLVLLFLGINSYLTDCYGRFSTSALAANSLAPQLFGAGFSVFASQMFESLGPAWASSILGFIALGMALFPPLLYVYGKRLRAASKFHLSAIEM